MLEANEKGEWRRNGGVYGSHPVCCKKIDGDYAWLENTEHPEREPVFIARALLPDTVFEGAQLQFENFEYTQL